MMTNSMKKKLSAKVLGFTSAFALTVFFALPALAHCDTMNGPVVIDAKAALEKGDVTPVLKWVGPEDEAGIRKAFDKTLAVRAKNPEAKEIADMDFFETLVRIHRQGEGEPYTGLKSSEPEPEIAMADNAIDAATMAGLEKELTARVKSGLKEKFEEVVEAKKHKDESVDDGRKYVETYVAFMHYVEALFADSAHSSGHKCGKEVKIKKHK